VLIIPAIDLRGGRCVRLRQGDYEQETVFDGDPLAVAQRWVAQGAKYLHLVDLDGARSSPTANDDTIQRIVQSSGVRCQVGGGLRDDRIIDERLAWGVDRVIVGTRAAQDPDWFSGLCRRHPGRVLLGMDTRAGQVAVAGWTTVVALSAFDLLRRCAGLPLAGIVYTDILRDGMLSGPNFEAYKEIVAASPWPIIASGGITTLGDVRRLTDLGLAACIVGRALYEGRFDLREAIRAFYTDQHTHG
jgi:phosphoribosylformimino-5-aminoimidazole carboxamide ribotide isomerase